MPPKPPKQSKASESKPLTLLFVMDDGTEYRLVPEDVTRNMKITLDRDMGRTFGECISRIGEMVSQGVMPDALYIAPLLWGARMQTDEKFRGSIASCEADCPRIASFDFENVPDGDDSPEASSGN